MSIKILIVDDNKPIRDALTNLLEIEDGIKIIGTAIDGNKALQFIDEKIPDLIIMDVAMPYMNGIETTKRILLKHPEIKIIGLTIYNNRYIISAMKEAGASQIVSKDNSYNELVDAINKIMKKK